MSSRIGLNHNAFHFVAIIFMTWEKFGKFILFKPLICKKVAQVQPSFSSLKFEIPGKLLSTRTNVYIGKNMIISEVFLKSHLIEISSLSFILLIIRILSLREDGNNYSSLTLYFKRGLLQPHFGLFLVPLLHFGKDCHSVNLPTSCADTHVSMKTKFKHFCREICWGGGWGVTRGPRPEREGAAAETNKFS